MSRQLFAFSLLLAAMMLAAQSALADGTAVCAPREQVAARLAERFGETPRAMGLNGDAALLEIFASEETGSWTLVITGADGTACIIATGQAFQAAAPAPPAPREDA